MCSALRLYFSAQFFLVILHIALPVYAGAEAYNPEIKPAVKEALEQEVTEEREQSQQEDPLTQRKFEKEQNSALHSILFDDYSFYGSLRLRYRQTEEESFVGDGGSRFGVKGHWQFIPDYWFLFLGESGFALLDRLDLTLDPGGNSQDEFGDDLFVRLAYVGIETPLTMLTYGKNWSTYYQVASFTDRFQGAGAGASGAFNAGTDGGPAGTGRADQVLQTRIQIDHPWGPFSRYKPFDVNLQFQTSQHIPYTDGKRYSHSVGASAIVAKSGLDNFKVGIAANVAFVDSDDHQ